MSGQHGEFLSLGQGQKSTVWVRCSPPNLQQEQSFTGNLTYLFLYSFLFFSLLQRQDCQGFKSQWIL